MRSSYANSGLPCSLDRSRHGRSNVNDARSDEEIVHRALVRMDRGEAEARRIEERERDVPNGERRDQALHVLDLGGLADHREETCLALREEDVRREHERKPCCGGDANGRTRGAEVRSVETFGTNADEPLAQRLPAP